MNSEAEQQKERLVDENSNYIDCIDCGDAAAAVTKMASSQLIHDVDGGEDDENRQAFNVFTYDHYDLHALLVSHGIVKSITDLLLEHEVNGREMKQWPCELEALTAYLNSRYFRNTSKRDAARSSADKSMLHLQALLARYARNPYCAKTKIISDNIHGNIKIHPLLIRIIDTPQFQRLRHLKQLGILHYIYPTANHSRFEHSIGCSHLAGVLMSHLCAEQPSLGITKCDELCVRIAGLCHDMGHGPFSHMFEEVIDILEVKCWKHEMATLKLFDKMLAESDELRAEFRAYGLFDDEEQLIKDLVHSEAFKQAPAHFTVDQKIMCIESLKKRGFDKSFMFEIVSNYRNGIDVDKFDYFERDSAQLGFKNNFNHRRYIDCTRVIRSSEPPYLTQICVRDKEITNLYEMFHIREYLTRRAYKHETGTSINIMTVEALVKADSYFKFSSLFDDVTFDRYERLNDSIFLQILYSQDERLAESRAILERIQQRKLFKYVGSVVLPTETDELKHKKAHIEHDFFAFLSERNESMNRDNVVLDLVRFNYGSKNKNPLENLACYNKYRPNTMIYISKDQISGMLLNVFEDVVLRVYSKNTASEFINGLNSLFKAWCKTKAYGLPLYGTSN